MKDRIISAMVALLIFIPLLIVGGIYFKIGIIIISLIALYEIIRLKDWIPNLINIISYMLLVMIIVSENIDISIILLILSSLLIVYDNKKYNVLDFTFISLFTILIGTISNSIIYIREYDINILIYMLLITTLTDTIAYVVGSNFGKHYFVQNISPKKTLEGSISGSLIGTIIPCIYYIYMVNPGVNIFLIILLTLFLSIIGQIGDLVFSSIKRYFKIKDYSNIMKGHGGILDRLDSLIFVVLAYTVIISLIQGGI